MLPVICASHQGPGPKEGEGRTFWVPLCLPSLRAKAGWQEPHTRRRGDLPGMC